MAAAAGPMSRNEKALGDGGASGGDFSISDDENQTLGTYSSHFVTIFALFPGKVKYLLQLLTTYGDSRTWTRT